MLKRSLMIVCVLILGLTGCQVWEKTKAMYRGTLFPAQVDVKAEDGMSQEIRYLARLVTPVDTQLEELVRKTQQIGNASEQDLQALFSNFSWLNGVGAYSSSGQLVHQVPAQPVKNISPQAELENFSPGADGLYLYVEEQDLGPELCLVKPIDNAGQVAAYVVVHFDPRTLFSRSPVPENLVVIQNGKILWSGMENGVNQGLADKDWEGMLQSEVQGDLVVHEHSFVWLSRYVGQDPLIYVVKMAGSNPRQKEG